MVVRIEPEQLKVFYDAGYTNDDIKNAINTARQSGKSDAEIRDNVFKKVNELDTSTFGENLSENWKRFQRGIPTAIGQAVESVRTGEAFKDLGDKAKRTATGALIGGTIGSAVPVLGTTAGAITGGLAGLMGGKEFVNAMLSPYNTSLDQPFSLQAVKYGIRKNPLDVALDFLTMPKVGTGLKGLGQAGVELAGKYNIPAFKRIL